MKLTRRKLLSQTGLLAATALLLHSSAVAQSQKVRVGLMLPYTGTYAQLGTAITNGFKLAVSERGGKLGGREMEYFTVDDEAEPSKAPENTNKLVQRDKVDVLVGTVHSGVQMGMVKIAKESNTLLIIPNAGAGRRHRRAVRAEYLSHFVFQLAALVSDGQGARRSRHSQCRLAGVEIRRRRRSGCGFHRGFHQSRRQIGARICGSLSRMPSFSHCLPRSPRSSPMRSSSFLPAPAPRNSSRIMPPPVCEKPFRCLARDF